MIDFHTPTPADRGWVTDRVFSGGARGSEFSFANLLLWAGAYGQQVARWEDFLLVRCQLQDGGGYFWPMGSGDPLPALAALEQDAAERGEKLLLVCLSAEQVKTLEALRPEEFDVEPHRDGWDYLYEINKLADLGGRKLHSKRNHCKRFEENNPDWSFAPMTRDHLSECLALDEEWDRQSREREGAAEAEDMTNERKALLTAAKLFEELGLEGGVLHAGGRLVAFTMGDPISADTFDVHFEKAYNEIQGAYAMINREFARYIRERYPQVKYLNREEDMGIEGLRKAKESYSPDLMGEKHWAFKRS